MTIHEIMQVRQWLQRARPRMRTQLYRNRLGATYGLILRQDGTVFATDAADDALDWAKGVAR